jgi:hypothetical protein
VTGSLTLRPTCTALAVQGALDVWYSISFVYDRKSYDALSQIANHHGIDLI